MSYFNNMMLIISKSLDWRKYVFNFSLRNNYNNHYRCNYLKLFISKVSSNYSKLPQNWISIFSRIKTVNQK